jgi:hypothetical protein
MYVFEDAATIDENTSYCWYCDSLTHACEACPVMAANHEAEATMLADWAAWRNANMPGGE